MTITDTIESYRKRRKQLAPLLLGMVIVVLVVVGIVLINNSLRGGGLKLFASRTPTVTLTLPPTNTLPPSGTPTITPTPTNTPPSEPYDYTVLEGDSLSALVQSRNLGENGILLILILNPYTPANAARPGIDPNTQTIFVGQIIKLPIPGMPLPSPTPWPTNAVPGTRINYFILPGDNLGAIAAKLNSTVTAIFNANKTLLIDGENTILYPGWILVVPVNLVTPVPTPAPTATATTAP